MTELARLAAITKIVRRRPRLAGVDFDVQAGEVHALLGENGAGKSTLMRVLGGEMLPSSGAVLIAGAAVHFRDPRDARAQGIAVIHQELALAPDLSVAENIFLGELSRRHLLARAPAARARADRALGFDIDPARRVGSLAVAHQQVVEIAKALSREVKIIVFDEPTAVLSTQDAERLHAIIARLRSQGVGIVYISHRLDEVFRISDRMTVMKDGQVVGTWPPRGRHHRRGHPHDGRTAAAGYVPGKGRAHDRRGAPRRPQSQRRAHGARRQLLRARRRDRRARRPGRLGPDRGGAA